MGLQLPALESQHVLELSNFKSLGSEISLLRPRFIVVHTLCFLHYLHAVLGYHRTNGHLSLSSVAIRYRTTLSKWRTRASLYSGACSPETALQLGPAGSARSTSCVTPHNSFSYENASATNSTPCLGEQFQTLIFVVPRLASNDSVKHNTPPSYIRQGDLVCLAVRFCGLPYL